MPAFITNSVDAAAVFLFHLGLGGEQFGYLVHRFLLLRLHFHGQHDDSGLACRAVAARQLGIPHRFGAIMTEKVGSEGFSNRGRYCRDLH